MKVYHVLVEKRHVQSTTNIGSKNARHVPTTKLGNNVLKWLLIFFLFLLVFGKQLSVLGILKIRHDFLEFLYRNARKWRRNLHEVGLRSFKISNVNCEGPQSIAIQSYHNAYLAIRATFGKSLNYEISFR